MRVLSFIPAFLLAATSFVAAAPASVDTTCVSHPLSGNGNDAALQPVIAILANATAYIQPLNGQLTGLKGSDSCTSDAVGSIVVEITAVISTCVSQLEAVVAVDLTSLDLTNLCATIYALLALICTTLNTLVAIVIYLGADAIGTIQAVINNLLNAVIGLVGCLKIFVDASLSGVLGPVTVLVCGVVDLLLSVVVGVNVGAVTTK